MMNAVDVAGASRAVRVALGVLVIGSMMVTFALSMAAIVYSGPLASHLSAGIAFTLIGAVVMGIVGPLTLSYRGAIVQPQDVTAILLALAAAAIVAREDLAPEAAFPTVVAMIAVTSIATGLAAWAMGAFRLGYLVRYVPFPVVSGFLAASGALLMVGALDMAVPGDTAEGGGRLTTLALGWPLWLPWLVIAVVMVWLVRRTSDGTVIPAVLALALIGFYLVVWVAGLDLAAMRALGLLLGPFEGQSFAGSLSLDLVSGVDWYVVATQFPMILTIAALALLGTLLNASGLEVALGRDIDLERDLKGVGVANVVAGFGGGMVGYHLLAETLLARRFGVAGAWTGLLVIPACLAVLFVGAGALSYLPIGLFAAVIWFLGLELLLTAIFDHGLRMPRLDFAIVLLMPVIALAFGFMPAVGFGVTMAAVLFVVAYAQVDVVRLSTTGASLRARVERGPQDMERLAAAGGRVRIHRLSGFLFFGSASQLVERLHGASPDTDPPDIVLVDLEKVSGLDMTAWTAFERLGRRCAQDGTKLKITGLSPALIERFKGWAEGPTHVELAGDLDSALEEIENRLLGEADAGPRRADTDGEFTILLKAYGEWLYPAAGEALLREGEASDHILFLLQGRCRASVKGPDGREITVQRFLPGAIVGEIGFYAGVPRTADVIADTPVVAVRVSSDALARMVEDNPAEAIHLHRRIAALLARRLMATTRLIRDAQS